MAAVALQPRADEDLSARFRSPYSTISFKHPAYADSDDILLKLPRLDRTEDGSTTGVHHHTALRACQIIANKSFHGYLAADRDGRDVVTVAPDDLLTEDSYWFIVERPDGNEDIEQRHGRDVYPIVPSFDEWAFPHREISTLGWDAESTPTPLPPPSSASSTTFAIPALPRPQFQRCVLSNSAYSICKAHLVPLAKIKWFRINNMKRYDDDEQQASRFINNARNLLPIRQDLHTMWDPHAFAFVPKHGQFVAHILTAPTPGSREFATEWQNRPIQRNAFEGVAKPYLFAKFAQDVFMLLKPFVACSPVGRYVARLRATADEMGECEVWKEWVSGKSLEDLYSGGGSRRASESPSGSRKRSRSQASANDEEWVWPHKTSQIHVHPFGYESEEWLSESDEEERGRPLKRKR